MEKSPDLLRTARKTIHSPPTGRYFHPQPVDNGGKWNDSVRNLELCRVKLLANGGAVDYPRCQLTIIIFIPY